MDNNVSLLAEIPEQLHDALLRFIDLHPSWDQDRVFSAALSLFLLQNSGGESSQSSPYYRDCAQVYLETLFQQSAA
ncbi:protein of unknown function (DUF2811) [Rubidibacter lacunae KORDI 51-2]|uniref:DUF2811 domain-containing protein n=1 Tax=Rubidibacter lacunae KORDI 51-2 TaxID=582515 RepID=U5DBT1_9CHRO|nr:DUF2811 domain-containing protein [Rubidibacter lacunae]ERN41988.1 protein of unknown function (DUF2811) [Rubidibacter lacunae KORDI 51-2]